MESPSLSILDTDSARKVSMARRAHNGLDASGSAAAGSGGRRSTPMVALKDVMSRHYESVHPDASAREAFRMMSTLNLSMLPVSVA